MFRMLDDANQCCILEDNDWVDNKATKAGIVNTFHPLAKSCRKEWHCSYSLLLVWIAYDRCEQR